MRSVGHEVSDAVGPESINRLSRSEATIIHAQVERSPCRHQAVVIAIIRLLAAEPVPVLLREIFGETVAIPGAPWL
jgi:hypothetical protein